MGYIGNQTSNSYTSITKQDITGDGTTGPYTLDHAVANAQEIEVFVNNVRQEPGVAYTVSGTTLTMTGNVASTDDFYVVFQGKALQTTVPPDDSVTTARINDGAVTTAKIADNAVTGAKISGLPTGSILQVVSNSYSTSTSITSTTKGSGTSTGLTATITPNSTSNKLLLMGTVHLGTGYSSDPAFSIEIYDGSSIVYTDASSSAFYANGDGNEAYSTTRAIHAYIDAPSTSATTYTVRAFKSSTTTVTAQNASNPSILTIMEIQG